MSKEVISGLKAQVGNAVVFWSNLKGYHWQVSGPRFQPLHELFGSYADSVYGTIDDLAERVRMLGDDPPSSLEALYKAGTVETASAKSASKMIAEALSDTRGIIGEMRDLVKAAEKDGDAGTVDLISKFVQIYEKHEWFLREHLKAE